MLDSLNPTLVVGVDLSPVALSLAAKAAPSATLVRADINQRLPFVDDSFDVATIFNVLYHQWVRDEGAVLAEVARTLRPGGLIFLTEPAFDSLRREMDDIAMTRRRYHTVDFDRWLDVAGFETLFSTYFTSFGYPILLAAKYINGIRSGPLKRGQALDVRPLPKLANEALAFTATLENFALSRTA